MMNVTLNKEIHLSLNVCTPVVFFPRTYEVICHWLGLSYFRYTSRTIPAVLLSFLAISRDQTAVGIL